MCETLSLREQIEREYVLLRSDKANVPLPPELLALKTSSDPLLRGAFIVAEKAMTREVRRAKLHDVRTRLWAEIHREHLEKQRQIEACALQALQEGDYSALEAVLDSLTPYYLPPEGSCFLTEKSGERLSLFENAIVCEVARHMEPVGLTKLANELFFKGKTVHSLVTRLEKRDFLSVSSERPKRASMKSVVFHAFLVMRNRRQACTTELYEQLRLKALSAEPLELEVVES
jgi:hypothetical protein